MLGADSLVALLFTGSVLLPCDQPSSQGEDKQDRHSSREPAQAPGPTGGCPFFAMAGAGAAGEEVTFQRREVAVRIGGGEHFFSSGESGTPVERAVALFTSRGSGTASVLDDASWPVVVGGATTLL